MCARMRVHVSCVFVCARARVRACIHACVHALVRIVCVYECVRVHACIFMYVTANVHTRSKHLSSANVCLGVHNRKVLSVGGCHTFMKANVDFHMCAYECSIGAHMGSHTQGCR